MRGESRSAFPVPVPRSGALGLLAAEEPPAPPAARSPQLAALRSRARASPGLPRRSYPDGNSRAAPTGSPGPVPGISPGRPGSPTGPQDRQRPPAPPPSGGRCPATLRLLLCFFYLFFFFPPFCAVFPLENRGALAAAGSPPRVSRGRILPAGSRCGAAGGGLGKEEIGAPLPASPEPPPRRGPLFWPPFPPRRICPRCWGCPLQAAAGCWRCRRWQL